ncbi:MAG: glycosyltransferase family 4 protein [Phormidesmis sp.]
MGLPEHEIYLIEFGKVSLTYQWNPVVAEFPYKQIILSEQASESQKITYLISSLIRELNHLKPDVLVIAGYASFGMLSALLWALWNQRTTVLLSETTEADSPRSPYKEWIKRLLVRRYRAALVGGQPQKRYLIQLGMPEQAITLGYDVVGNEAFHPTQIQHLSRSLPRPYFLTINRFIQKKNLPFVVDAYAAYREEVGDAAWDLVLCGDGILLPQLKQQIHTLGLEQHIHLPGFLQQHELLPYFAHADCFIHASTHEQWGLVVNEAMASGLPVLVSNRCGCYEDLILEGVNGFGFDSYNQQQLTDLMIKMSSGAVDLQTMGQASLQHIQKYSPAYFAQGLKQAIDYALAHS